MSLARVRYFGSIHDVVGSAREEVNLEENASVQELLAALVAKHGPDFERRLVTPSGKLQAHARMFIGGQEIDYLKLESPVFGVGQASTDVEIFIIQQSMGG